MRKKKRVAVRRKKRVQLSVFDRTKIALKRSEGWGVRRIALLLKRPPSTISREIRRNASGEKRLQYHPEVAHRKAIERKEAHGIRPRLKGAFIQEYVREKLKEGWSPEQIALRLPIDHKGQRISKEAIYQFVYAPAPRKKKGSAVVDHEDLRVYLTRRHRRRQKKGFRTTQKLYATPLPSIEDRPAVVDKRTRIGDWEDDTIVSRANTHRVKSINERVSGVILLGKMKDGTITESNRVVIERLSQIPEKHRKTLTRDRGTENLGHKEIEKELRMTCFFAHAYCSQERGSNENGNGLVRRVYPKKTDWKPVTDADLRRLERQLNSRPRKRLGGKTPYEVFFERTGVALAH
jgi:IS30 family transposase